MLILLFNDLLFTNFIILVVLFVIRMDFPCFKLMFSLQWHFYIKVKYFCEVLDFGSGAVEVLIPLGCVATSLSGWFTVFQDSVVVLYSKAECRLDIGCLQMRPLFCLEMLCSNHQLCYHMPED
jgi:hypothetical protein